MRDTNELYGLAAELIEEHGLTVAQALSQAGEQLAGLLAYADDWNDYAAHCWSRSLAGRQPEAPTTGGCTGTMNDATRHTGEYISPVMQLAALAAAQRAGYRFAASELATVEGETYEFVDDNGYHYWINESGDVDATAPWQLWS